MKCYYETLNIPLEATDDDIKRAYRKLALRYHPGKVENIFNDNHFEEEFDFR